MAIETAKESETNTLTLKTKIVPGCPRASTKIEIVEGVEDEGRKSGVIRCWRTSQAFQLSHIVRRV